ncbi:MAG: peptidylprolyl isomerase [Leptolyngbya sp. PLA2]|nr:peptidylprolyl isomerase [Leptolyngbya sp.]MCE7971608.1 peptidylprolyl isomerase [Leptolyngbya sp. PL-A2]MCZ7632644.1 peptidylprolyl isomerase [Phycisphaerales bacterium]MDL1904903.1 peptidylprolyl isomerase [Synechococcales cyanobacterium CNB]
MNHPRKAWRGLFLRTFAAWAGCFVLAACSSQSETREGPSARDLRGLEASERQVSAGRQPTAVERPPVMVEGEPVSWDEMRAILSEAAGAAAVEEVALTRIVEAEFGRRGLQLTEADLRRERELVERSLAAEGAGSEAASELLSRIRRSRGLGPTRFEGLLRRNAMLRQLVQGEVEITEEQVRTAHAVRHGPRCRARIIVVASEREAAQARSRVEGAADRRAAFIEEAVSRSSDASGPRGGLLEPISPADPAYPVSVRRALDALRPGELSPVVALESGYALLLLEERTEGDGTAIEAVRGELERLLRLRQERVLMDRTASQMVETARITVFDPSLEWSWRTRRQD